MNGHLETLLDTALARSPAQPVFQWQASRQLTVLAYHGIDSPHCFARQLDYLTQTMHPVTLDEVLKATTTGRGLPKRAVLITFDDGDRTVLEVARPMLQERGLPAVVFVVAGLLNTNLPYWWTEVEALVRNGGTARGFDGLSPSETVTALKKVADEHRLTALTELQSTAQKAAPLMPQLRREELPLLEAAGIVVGNHTLTHPCLPFCTDEKICYELYQAHTTLAAALGHAPRAFAYPNGDTTERAKDILSALGYEIAFLFDHHLNHLPLSNPYEVSRVRVNSTTPLDRFRIIVSGLHPALHHLGHWC